MKESELKFLPSEIKGLRDEIDKGNAIIIVGAGTSIAATNNNEVSSWKGLLRSGVNRCTEYASPLKKPPITWREKQLEILNNKEALIPDLLSVALNIEYFLGDNKSDNFKDWINWAFEDLNKKNLNSEVIEAIINLGAPIVTTNYDDLIENTYSKILKERRCKSITWMDKDEISSCIRMEKEAILHLHGYYEKPESIVLSPFSYGKILNDKFIQEVQRAVATFKTMIFIGFGSGKDDPNVGNLFEWINLFFGGISVNHYVLVSDDDFVSFHDNGPKITSIPYGQHKDLGRFISEKLSSSNGLERWEKINYSIPHQYEDSKEFIELKSNKQFVDKSVSLKREITKTLNTQDMNSVNRKALEILKMNIDSSKIFPEIFSKALNFLQHQKGFKQIDILKKGMELLSHCTSRLPKFCSFIEDHESPEMVVIPSGEFLMGSLRFDSTEKMDLSLFIKKRGSYSELEKLIESNDEKPVRLVKVRRLAVSKYLISLKEYQQYNKEYILPDEARKALTDNNYFPYSDSNLPVVGLTWKDAYNYCLWLSKKHGRTYRLLTEAEWEYICRAGTLTNYYWGNEYYYSKSNPLHLSKDRKNNWALYDMIGVVYQWVQDHYSDYTDRGKDLNGLAHEFENPTSRMRRVARGGAYNDIEFNQFRSAFRGREEEHDSKLNDVGLRICFTIDE